jgi:hypothetical protein
LSEEKDENKIGFSATEPLFFYDPQSSFGMRIWAGLNADIVHVKIETGISEIMKKTSSYVRKGMNRESYECLNIFNQMIAASNTRDALSAMYVGKSLFSGVHCPTSEMISLLQYSFGTIVDVETALQKPVKKLSQLVRKIKNQAQKSILKSGAKEKINLQDKIRAKSPKAILSAQLPIGLATKEDSAVTLNISQLQTTQPNIKRTPNFIQLYKSQYPSSQTHPRERNNQAEVFNYSRMEMNSTSYQMQVLRDGMKGSVFWTYGTEYLGQTVGPIDVEEEGKRDEIRERSRWLTPNGFI